MIICPAFKNVHESGGLCLPRHRHNRILAIIFPKSDQRFTDRLKQGLSFEQINGQARFHGEMTRGTNPTLYAYDDAYRFVSESYTGGLTINYTYDAEGNRLTATGFGFIMTKVYDTLNQIHVPDLRRDF